MQSKKICLVCVLAALLAGGCGYSQTVKDSWKGTRSLWYEYANVPAQVDYTQTGDLDKAELALATRMLEIDSRLTALERAMSNADKPPTQEWLQKFFQQFPWLGGFAGVRADGRMLGQEPATPMKPVDFSPLLEADDKDKDKRALRSYVQNTPMGPEVYLAVPLFNADEFLGIIACHFDMRALLKFAVEPEELMIFTPHTVLWPGKYDFASTPAASVNWEKTVKSEARGVCANTSGAFMWVTRYLANQPLIFAVPMSGSFAEGRGEVGSFADQEPAAVRKASAAEHEDTLAVPSPLAHPEENAGAASHEDSPEPLGGSGGTHEPLRAPSPFGPY